jgi:hypothetical protein
LPFKQKPKSVSDYQNNLFLAVQDIWTEMYVDELPPAEIEFIIKRDVEEVMDDIRKWALKDLHEQTAYHKRKMR